MSTERTEVVIDETGRERRKAVLGSAACPRCGEDVELVAETEEWVEGGPDNVAKWCHQSYGPACGVCCGVLVVDSWDGCSAFDLASQGEPRDDDDLNGGDDFYDLFDIEPEYGGGD